MSEMSLKKIFNYIILISSLIGIILTAATEFPGFYLLGYSEGYRYSPIRIGEL